MLPIGTEEFVYQAVLSGELWIDHSGAVWRIAQARANRWNGTRKVVAVEPRRIDWLAPSGYRLVKIMRHRRQVSTLAHRLVWRHLRGPIPDGMTINHINGVKSDNRLENLELATYQEQAVHARWVLGRVPQGGEFNNHSKLTAEAVAEIRRRRAAGERLKAIAQDFGVSDRTVSKIALGQRWGG